MSVPPTTTRLPSTLSRHTFELLGLQIDGLDQGGGGQQIYLTLKTESQFAQGVSWVDNAGAAENRHVLLLNTGVTQLERVDLSYLAQTTPPPGSSPVYSISCFVAAHRICFDYRPDGAPISRTLDIYFLNRPDFSQVLSTLRTYGLDCPVVGGQHQLAQGPVSGWSTGQTSQTSPYVQSSLPRRRPSSTLPLCSRATTSTLPVSVLRRLNRRPASAQSGGSQLRNLAGVPGTLSHVYVPPSQSVYPSPPSPAPSVIWNNGVRYVAESPLSPVAGLPPRLGHHHQQHQHLDRRASMSSLDDGFGIDVDRPPTSLSGFSIARSSEPERPCSAADEIHSVMPPPRVLPFKRAERTTTIDEEYNGSQSSSVPPSSPCTAAGSPRNVQPTPLGVSRQPSPEPTAKSLTARLSIARRGNGALPAISVPVEGRRPKNGVNNNKASSEVSKRSNAKHGQTTSASKRLSTAKRATAKSSRRAKEIAKENRLPAESHANTPCSRPSGAAPTPQTSSSPVTMVDTAQEPQPPGTAAMTIYACEDVATQTVVDEMPVVTIATSALDMMSEVVEMWEQQLDRCVDELALVQDMEGKHWERVITYGHELEDRVQGRWAEFVKGQQGSL